MPVLLRTAGLLLLANVFMTFACTPTSSTSAHVRG